MFIFLAAISCNDNGSSPVVNTQGIFDFPDELGFDTKSETPTYLDASKVLCQGKGIKVARCISEQLKTGICLGIIKEGKEVFVLEIDCNEVKEKPELESIN